MQVQLSSTHNVFKIRIRSKATVGMTSARIPCQLNKNLVLEPHSAVPVPYHKNLDLSFELKGSGHTLKHIYCF